MGNEASRGLSPGGTLPPTPGTPGGGLRRAKSFSNDAPSPSTSPASAAPAQLDRSIQRMDKTIRKRVRGGITYNMKIILRGDRGTGKTSLFQRLKGEPIPAAHAPTPQLQSATINWSFRANSEESVKCDVWDVVDKGFVPASDQATTGASGAPDANPFEAAAAAAAQGTAGAHLVATVDATTVDVYHETHGVVFLLDVTKPHTLEYVRQHLDQVPVHIPTLVLGNFRDCGAQRKIFKEDIQELLYGGAVAHHQPVRRPHELLYFECSLLNCYGLKSLHQYFGIPFLQLKQQTIRQQLRILEGEFTHLKHDLQAKISEQKYADYLDHIKASGSDIRTGRRAAAAAARAQAGATATTGAASGTSESPLEEESPTSATRLDRTLSSSSDIVVHSETAQPSAVESPVTGAQPPTRQIDLEDLPERTAALAQAGNSLKIDYTAEERQASKRQQEMPPLPGSAPVVSAKEPKHDARDVPAVVKTTAKKSGERKPAKNVTSPTAAKSGAAPDGDAPMNLEDFQVPKPRYNDLDSFYSDDDSDAEDAEDDDVVISTASARLAKAASAKYHKQQFLDSDESDSDSEKRAAQRNAPPAPPSKQRSPRRHMTKPSVEEIVQALDSGAAASDGVAPSPPSPVRPPSRTGSLRLPASPPRSTTSPQHSPRRRVKEPQNSGSDEPHSEERASGLDIPPGLPDQELASTIAPCERTTPAEDEDEEVVAENAPTATESAVLVGASADHEQHETIQHVPEGDSTSEAATAVTTDKSPDIDVAAEDLDASRAEQHEDASLQNSDDGLTEVSRDQPAPNIVEEVLDEAEMVVQAATGDIDALFSDGEDEEDEGESNVNNKSIAVVETDAAQDGDVSVVSSSSTVGPRLETPTTARIHDHSDSDEDVPVARSNGIVSHLKQQHHSIELPLDDGDSDAADDVSSSNATSTSLLVKETRSTARGRKVEILLSESEDSDAPPASSKPVDAPRPAPRPQPSIDLTSIPSPPLAPAVATDSGNLGDILESFLNDSGSDFEDNAPTPVVSHMVAKEIEESDNEDEVKNDRFAAYDMKRSTQRRSKTSRRWQLDDFSAANTNDGTNTASLSSSQTSSFSTTSESTTRATSIANQDVLAAIRAAELDALKMLEASTPLPTHVSAVETGGDDSDTIKKKKKSSSRSSSKKSNKEGDNDGDESSKKKQSKKKKDKGGGSSSRSKRREMILTDEDE